MACISFLIKDCDVHDYEDVWKPMDRVHGCLILGVGEKVLSSLYHCFRSFSRAEKAIWGLMYLADLLSWFEISSRALHGVLDHKSCSFGALLVPFWLHYLFLTFTLRCSSAAFFFLIYRNCWSVVTCACRRYAEWNSHANVLSPCK